MIQLCVAALLSTLLYVFSFAPWSFDFPILSQLQWFAFVPLFYFLSKNEVSYRRTFLLGFLVCVGITLGGFYWIVHATEQYGGIPTMAAVGLLIALCFVGQLHLPLYLVLRQKALEHFSFGKWVLLAGLAYAGIESFYPKIFLDTAGHAFADSLLVSQVADIGGVFLITSLVIVFAEAFVRGIGKDRKYLLVCLAVLAFSFGYGAFRVGQIEPMLQEQVNGPSLKVAMVQANIGDYLKISAERGLSGASDQVISEYLKYSTQALASSPDSIIWPETAYPALFGHPLRGDERRMERLLREFAQSFPGTMIFGGYDQDPSTLADYNSIFFLPPSEAATGARVPTYHKNILLMFGETLPFYEWYPAMKGWFPTMGFFGRGPGPEVYTVFNAKKEAFKLAPSICYEGLFPYFSHDGALQGADALLNVTNDSWFGRYGEPYLHFALTRFRSIETRLPMLRSTNTGITAMIDALGRVEGKTELFEGTVLPATIHPRLDMKTPVLAVASVMGFGWFERLAQFATLGLLVFLYYRRKKSS